jgi:hypothetical protein
MAWEEIAAGSGDDLDEITSIESQVIEEGQRAKIVCQTITPIGSWQIDDLRDSLNAAGVEDLQISGSGNTVEIIWRKGFPWAAVIILALVAIIAVAAWAFFREVPDSWKPLAIVAGAAALFGALYLVWRET